MALTHVNAQPPTWVWASCPFGNGLGEGIHISAESNGNSFITGSFYDTLIFGTDTLINNFSISSHLIAFIAKYDNVGNPVWAKCPAGNGTSGGISSTPDDSGNVYWTGVFDDSTSIQFDTVILNNSGYDDIFLVKYDALGNLLWAKVFGGTNIDDVSGIATDNSGNVYITGSFKSPAITFDTVSLINTGSSDVFTAKLNSSGSVLWAKSGTGIDYAASTGISTDDFNNVYICGNYNDSTIIFGDDTLNNLGYEDIFLIKYNSLGNVVWAKSANGSFRDVARGIRANHFGKIVMTGYFDTASVSFPPFTLFSHAQYNTFIVQYDSSGSVDWANSSLGGKGLGESVTTDNCGNIDVVGNLLTPTITFDSIHLVSPYFNIDNMFFIQLNSFGQVIWGTALKFGGDDQMSIAADNTENIYLGGDFLIAPIYIANDTLTHTGHETPFVAKLNIKCSVGIPESQNTFKFILYPNPFANSISVLVDDPEQSQITIYNVLSGKCLQKSFSKSCFLNTETLSSGIYIYEISNSNGIIGNGKILKE